MPIQCRFNEALEEWLWCRWFRLEFGMELNGDEPRVVRDLDNLDQISIRTGSRGDHTSGYEIVAVFGIEFVSMPMPLRNGNRAITPLGP